MDATVTLQEGMHFIGIADTGHPVHMDSDTAVGGTDSAARPMELFLIGLGGCTGMDVISILRKKRQDVTGLEMKIHADRSGGHPNVFTAITIEYIVSGRDVDPAAVERAMELSRDRYCPAQAMLSLAAPIELTYKIVEEA